MKRVLIYMIAPVIFLSSCNEKGTSADVTSNEKPLAVSNSNNEGSELEAIMESIKNETACFYARDYECWKSYWVNTDYAAMIWNERDGTFTEHIGWENIDKANLKYLQERALKPDEISSHPDVKRKDLKVKFYGDNMAYLTWKQYNSNKDQTEYTPSRDVRVMEKADGKWLIVNMSSFWDYPNPVKAEDID